VGQEKKSPPSPTFDIIADVDSLCAFAAKAETAETVAVDLEADSMFHYQEKVCLIQMAANGHTVVIDPLQVPDLTPLRPVFAHKAIRKVFHGADYDIRSLYRDHQIIINNLFDTQLASMYLGFKETGLESVVAHRYGVELNKKYQKKDWSKRPLPEEMMCYAAWDVVFLNQLADELTEELDVRERLKWVKEECRLLSQVRPAENNGHPRFVKIKGAGRLESRQLAVLENLLEIRDTVARLKDRPLFKIISNAALLKIATTIPADLKTLRDTKILSDRQVDMYGKDIIEGIQKATALSKEQLPVYPRQRSPRMSPRVPARVKAIKSWRDQMAERLELDPALLFNRSLMRDLAVQRPQTMEELNAVPGIHQWQVETYGENIIQILKSQK
jgi:ribonuclease D